MRAGQGEHHQRFQILDRAYRAGDLDGVRAALGNPVNFPNCRHPFELAVGDHPLEYAIYWSPLPFIESLLKMGANPNYADESGFPSLIAALSTDRGDRYALVQQLLDAGARIDQRGLNDWTVLHYAVSLRDIKAVRLLLRYGADPALRTRIDDCKTPLEEAAAINFAEALEPLRRALSLREEPGT
ncbi:MAG: ankyrin repeat domain-containing protein [Proteobacteria bacterium]|nr:ankyrin repeat domain-containing protein [Pseudomonadota bacterium]